MPELPEVETVTKELDRKLKGKKIARVEVRLSKIVSFGPGTVSNIRKSSQRAASDFRKKLVGLKVRSVSRRAKLLIFDLSGPYSLLVHLKMTGQLIYLKAKEKKRKIKMFNRVDAPELLMPCKHTHVIVVFTDGSKLFYNDIRQFGYLKLVADKQLSYVKELLEFGPEPLSRDFTLKVFTDILKRRPNMPLKQLLIDPRLIAGIGNIYSDEILFRARILPTKRAKILKPKEILSLYKAIPYILKKGIKAKGSSVGDFIRTDGSWGSMGKYHYVYMRAKLPCKICGTIIKSIKFNGRTGSYCPSCQR